MKVGVICDGVKNKEDVCICYNVFKFFFGVLKELKLFLGFMK